MARFDFQELVERLPLVVYVDKLDEKSSPLYVNPQIGSLLGITRERVRQIKEKALSRLRHVSRARALESYLG